MDLLQQNKTALGEQSKEEQLKVFKVSHKDNKLTTNQGLYVACALLL